MSKKVNTNAVPEKNRESRLRSSNFFLKLGFINDPIFELSSGVFKNSEGIISDKDWYSPAVASDKSRTTKIIRSGNRRIDLSSGKREQKPL